MIEKKNANGLTEEEFLKAYNPNLYEKPSVTADILLFTIENILAKEEKANDEKHLKVLLIQRKDHPYIGKWALPGGFVNINESIEEAAYRELEEETNVKDHIYLEQLYTFSNPKRDPRMRVISTAYMALTPEINIKKTKANDDAMNADWFTIKRTKNIKETNENMTSKLELINEKLKIHMTYFITYSYLTHQTTITLSEESTDALAFDHIEILNMGLSRLKNKVNYTTIAFNLLPEKFTLTDLQQVYEILLDESLVKSNFRTKIAPMVEKTNEQKMNVAYHRPYLFKKNTKYINN